MKRRNFLKRLFSPLTLFGGWLAYIGSNFAVEKREKNITIPISSIDINIGEVKDYNKIFLVRDNDGIFALKAKCTHLGCKPIWNGKQFHCPCHGSIFTEEGDVIRGPAAKTLTHLLIKKERNSIIVNLNKPAPLTQRINL